MLLIAWGIAATIPFIISYFALRSDYKYSKYLFEETTYDGKVVSILTSGRSLIRTQKAVVEIQIYGKLEHVVTHNWASPEVDENMTGLPHMTIKCDNNGTYTPMLAEWLLEVEALQERKY